MQFANNLHHDKKKKKKKTNNNNTAAKNNNNDVTSFHPPILFCGECSACAAPPPAIGDVSFATSAGKRSQT